MRKAIIPVMLAASISLAGCSESFSDYVAQTDHRSILEDYTSTVSLLPANDASVIAQEEVVPNIPEVDVVNSDPTITIHQGDMIEVAGQDQDMQCTVGLVDADNRALYTAAHCGFNDGDIVYHKDHRIGTIYLNSNYQSWQVAGGDMRTDIQDTAMIVLDDGVVPGKNVFSGDVKATDITVDDQVCMFSRMQGVEHCGSILSLDEHGLEVDGALAVAGDSGGPAWVVGKGYYGVVSYGNSYSTGIQKL